MEEYTNSYIVEAIDLTHDAMGVCKLEDGYTVFVEDLLKGETAEIIITRRKKNYGFGKIVQRITKSPFRVMPKCQHFAECGSCGLMHMDYDVQLSFKKYRVETSIRHVHADSATIKDMLGMTNPYNYRNKVEIKFAQGEKGIEAGFFQAKSHTLVNLQECHIMAKRSFETLTLIKNICNELKIKAYEEKKAGGVLRSVVIKESYATGEIVLLFNTAKEFPEAKTFVAKLLAKIPEISGIGYTITDDESAMSTDPIVMMHGNDYLTDVINGITYKIGMRSFFQTNTAQTEILYAKAMEYAGLNKHEKLIDAYCGIGSIGLQAASQCYKVFGIEIIRSSIRDAKNNASINKIKNAFFEVGDVETVLEKWKKFNFDVIVVDPPRRGCSQGFINALLTMKIPRIVYVSCDQATLARDIALLEDGGYQMVEVTPIDMFPQTIHVETITLLSLKTA
ncbi:MAG TPA: 23S rRNA (uracil(1939)-C(5))-methyltransferase RlmD [Bacillota bacterium]|nr:23S rRNA (uracil(1939)-C(5))-methyltransferase RlmD [Bacillota bacterium]HPQ61736.1 23S rRNA (uracil(1939)-C(5))-methyltransferase RlmD [Bacillota bacterium]HRX91277.1 23S rRNA (uracil(1939)-C(5))-methyltransferase RlmD [Candidatus Izemoplasmatales bacterium]